MFIKRICLINFRNFAKFRYDFDRSITIVLGPNGSGKTNLLEAINLLSSGTSHRVLRDAEMVSWTASWARVEGEIVGREKTKNELLIVMKKGEKKLQINRKVKSNITYRGYFYTVWFGPEEMGLLVDEPQRRRQFLDRMLSLIKEEYALDLQKYQKVLRQRNRLLQELRLEREQLHYWDVQFCRLSAKLFRERYQACQFLNSVLRTQNLRMEYLPSPRRLISEVDLSQGGSLSNIEDFMQERLKGLTSRERQLGFTLIGPQKDDWRLYRNGKEHSTQKNLSLFGSRGEQRVAIINLKLAQAVFLQKTTHEEPVFLLDDVLSELDEENQERLKIIFKRQQVVLTTTDWENPLVRELCEKNAGIIELRSEKGGSKNGFS